MKRISSLLLSSLLALLAGFGLFVTPAAAAPGVAQVSWPPIEGLTAFLANPNVAYLLLVIGLLGLVAEVVTAGTVFPGTVGAIALILALIGLGQLPTNWAGAALILAGIVMFLLDIKVAGWGLSIGGFVAFGLGSALLFTPPWVTTPAAGALRLNPWLMIAMTAGVAAFFVGGVSVAIRAHLLPVAMGRKTIVGKIGTVKHALNPKGVVHLDGEEWSAASTTGEEIAVDAVVRVVAVRGLTLLVEQVQTTGE